MHYCISSKGKQMIYSFEQLCNVENVADRLNISMRTFANTKDRSSIEIMLHIIRQLRHAANINGTIDLDVLLKQYEEQA